MSLPIHDPVLIFALVMLIVLVAPLVFDKLRIPGIVGLIVAGAIVGPNGLGLLERDATIILLGTVGLLYLMFVAGIALDLNQFKKVKTRSLSFGLISFFAPQLLGIASALYLLDWSVAPAVLLGSIVGSHTLLAYPVASRLGLTKNLAVTTTMGGTIVTDMLALLLLAVVTRYTEGVHGAFFWITFVALIIAFLAAVVTGLPRLGRWFMRRTGNDKNLSFIFLVTALFVTSYLAQLVGLAPIIGAFVAGIVLNRLVPEVGPLMSRVKFVGEVFFIPFFLISVGMLVDFRSLAEGPDLWIAALLFTAIVVVGKFIGAKATQLLYGHSSAEGWLMLGLTIPQAAATLAVTLVGFDIGLFDQTVVNAVILMILITCVAGPWIVEKHGRAVALKEEAEPYRESEAPQRVLIPLANPATAHALVDLALAIRRDGSQEPVYPLAVVRPGRDVAGQVAAGEKLVGEAVVHAVAADVPVIPMTRVDTSPAHGVERAVAERRISHVVIGWGGPALPTERLFGSVLDRILELVQQTVIVARPVRPLNTYQRIVLILPPFAEREVGFDDAARDVKTMASRIGADLRVLVPAVHRKDAESHLTAAPPSVPTHVDALRRYEDLPERLPELVTDDDLVVLIGANREQVSWHPLLDRLPGILTQRFPETDLVSIRPSLTKEEREDQWQVPTSRDHPPDPLGFVLDLDAEEGDAALREMLEPVFQEKSKIDEVVRLVLHDVNAHRQEMGETILLLHTHTPLTDRQLRIAGASEEGIAFEELAHRVSAIFLLVNPIDVSPGDHLRSLAEMARAAHEIELLDFGAMRRRIGELKVFNAPNAGTPPQA